MDAENRNQLTAAIAAAIWFFGTIGVVGGLIYLFRLI